MRAHFGGSSRKSLVTSRALLDAAIKGADANSASVMSSDLFFVASILDSNIAVRRALSDPARDGSAKANFISELFGKKIGVLALGITTEIAALRWSAPKDLILVVEQLAIEAEASAANIMGELDRVEDEIFTAASAFAASSELRKVLTLDASNGSAAKSSLVAEILKGASASTTKLVLQMVNAWRGRSIEATFADYQWALAVRRNRLIALVRVATPLTQDQYKRLATALTSKVGQPVRINIEVDSRIVGGVSVKFADEIVDGSVSNRMAGAARALAGNK